MNSKRSYLDAVNAGRQRRSYASLEQLNRSLDTLEQRIERNREETAAYSRQPQRNAQPYGQDYGSQPARPRTPESRGAYDQSYQQPYQSIARDIERMRREEDGVAAFGKIAGELKGLREELRHQMASSLRREFDTLRRDFQQTSATGGKAMGKLGLDLERLSGAIQSLGDRADDRSINMLRLEIEQMRSALDTVAREETVRSVDRRWDAFDQRFNDFEHRISAGVGERTNSVELAALTDRLEQISRAVGNLPDSLSLSSLEEKVRTLSGALDHFIEQQGGRTSQTFAHIEERLDEISRAIVSATVAAQHLHVDPEPFERIEARISALARQIEEVAEDRAGNEVMEHLQALSRRVEQVAEDRAGNEVMVHLQALARRVEEVAARTAIPDDAIERLAYQISVIADKVDHAPKVPDVGEIFSGIEQRFDVLSNLFERRQEDALEQGNMLFRELERRLNDVAERFEHRQADAALDSNSIMKAIDARFSAFAKTLDSGRRDSVGDEAIRGLESRLEGISRRLDQSASQFASIDPDLVKSLESQVAGLSAHLARPSAPLPEFVDISPRLREIEKTIADSRESVIEAARTAAESAARSLAVGQPEPGAVSGLAEELKALEDLTRRSDERNSKTFEAIHDTLLKIVDRMTSLEREAQAPARKLELRDAPSIDAEDAYPGAEGPAVRTTTVERTPAQAAAAAAMAVLGAEDPVEPEQGKSPVRSMLGGLSRAFSRKKNTEKEPQLAGSVAPSEPVMDAAPSIDLDTPLDPKAVNRPLEPGSGGPDLNAIMRRVRDERSQPARAGETDAGKSDFIAAARRAAQAAAAEADVTNKRKADLGGPVKALRIGDILKTRRKSVLMAATAIMTGLAGLQLSRSYLDNIKLMAGLGDTPPVAARVDATPLGSTPPATERATATAPAPTAARMADMPADAIGGDAAGMAAYAEPASADMDATSAETVPMDAIPIEGMPIEGVKVAAVSPVEPVTDATDVPPPAPAASIEIPAIAGPLPLREAAVAGDAKALFEVATRYAEGRGMQSDMAAAAKWYERSGEFGFAPAQYRIGNMYEKGIGVTRDIAKSRNWYEKAAEQGNASAMHNLAVLYAMGADGQTDNDQAAKWFIKAAELGVKDSQFNLGILSAKGVGMTQSLEESYKWFALVAKTGDKDAANKRDEIANALRPEQLERARAASELWKPKTLDPEANTVDIPTSWQESGEKTASIDMKKAVGNIQAVLNKNGYDAGNADGVMGGKTKAAIAQFQKDNGLQPTGEIDETLVRKLAARD